MGSYGCDVAIRFVSERDVEAWVGENVTGFQTIDDGPFSYLQGAGEPAQRMYLAQRDAHTVIISNNAERLRRLATGAGMADAPEAADFAEQLASIDGGIATLAFRTKGLGSPISIDATLDELAMGMLGIVVEPGQPNPIATACRTIGDETEVVTLGVDLDAATSTISLRTAAACTNYAAANARAGELRVAAAVCESVSERRDGGGRRGASAR